MPETVREIIVDLWKTGLHGKEIGIKKTEEYMSKSKQFTKDMDIVGEIKEEGKESGFIGLRKSIFDKRLVLKAFSASVGWLGTLEESGAYGVSNFFITDHEFPCYIVIANNYPYLIEIKKLNGGAGFKEKFGSLIINDEDNTVDTLAFEERRLGLGHDWNVKTTLDKKLVADIDGKKIDVGGQYDIKIFEKDLAKHKGFIVALILFATSEKYHEAVEKRIKTIIADFKNGKKYTIDHDEAELYRNPRRKSW